MKYSAQDYMAGNQNWMITQDERRFMYAANNEGLLEFNGAAWSLYPSPNETIIRSVNVIGKRVYTGCYMEFGYWSRQSNGMLRYTSLSSKIKSKLIDDEQIWNILSFDQWVIFQSLNRLYLYDTQNNTFKIIPSKHGILKAFQTAQAIYYQPLNDGIYEIENGTSRLLISAASLANIRVVNIFPSADGLLLQTQQNGFYLFKNNVLEKFSIAGDKHLNETTIYSSIQLADGSFALGSISNGLFIISKIGELRHHITQNQGLSNNTVLSLFEDRDKNLWIGLDNGINCLNMSSPIQSFTDNTGILGTVYASVLFDGNLYVGTNQGLFCKKAGSTTGFDFISGTKGQVWSLFVYDNTLLCGHDSGTFIVKGQSARNIYSGSGTWKFELHPKNTKRIIQGNYNGLSYLINEDGEWKFGDKITGFNYSTKYFELLNDNIFVSHEYKGVFRLNMNPDFSKILSFKAYTKPSKGKNAGLAKYNGQILYAYKGGVFKFNESKDVFEKDVVISKAIDNDEYTSGKLIVDSSNKLWLFTKNRINYFSLGKLSSNLKMNTIPIPSSLTNSMSGYENISKIGQNSFLVGTTDGYYLLDSGLLQFSDYSVLITFATKSKFNDPASNLQLTEEVEVPYSENNITIAYAVPVFNKYIKAEYQFLLEGLTNKWSHWSTRSSSTFKNLPYGSYTFKVRARTGDSLSQNTADYHFTILRPWYWSWTAIFCYLLALALGGYFVHKAYRSYYHRQNEKLMAENRRQLEMRELENEQQLMKIRNEQLLLDVDNKNRELAASTMNLIKKNELLSMIKDDLKKTEDNSKNIKTVISTINKNISEEDTWDLFKEAFNNADKDFLKKIKSTHSLLTPNDLRLCAYLRLNLSSKEIAPLLNISVRSVEIKRYRLRKKMDLPHEQGLVEYILSV
ncbi:MAG TPA: triple tyrosine motif-containing protein [Flavobacterium sp.]